MVMQLSRRLSQIDDAHAYKVSQIGCESDSNGKKIIDLSIGEPDFRTPEHIYLAATQAMMQGHTKYTPVRGYPELIKAIQIKLQVENGLLYDSSEIIVSTGARQSFSNVLLALIEPGDEVIIPAPYNPEYVGMVNLSGGRVIAIQGNENERFKLKPETLIKAITLKTKMLILSSPCNPTGSVYSVADLESLVDILELYPDIIIVSDETYEYINYSGAHASIACFSPVRNRVVIINSMAKGFAMTGWQIGYLAGPGWLVQGCEIIQAQITSGVNSIAQYVATVALNGDRFSNIEMRRELLVRRDFLINALNRIDGISICNPDGTYYAFPSIEHFIGMNHGRTTISNSDDMSEYLLKDAGVYTVGSSVFGIDKHIRLSYACPLDVLKQAMERIEQSLYRLH